jgi:hypothetical protein
MYSTIFDYNLYNISQTTLGLVSVTSIYFSYKLLQYLSDKDPVQPVLPMEDLKILMDCIHEQPLETERHYLDSKIVSNKIKIYLYSKLLDACDPKIKE